MRENREVRTAGPWFNGLTEIKENSKTSKTVERGLPPPLTKNRRVGWGGGLKR